MHCIHSGAPLTLATPCHQTKGFDGIQCNLANQNAKELQKLWHFLSPLLQFSHFDWLVYMFEFHCQHFFEPHK